MHLVFGNRGGAGMGKKIDDDQVHVAVFAFPFGSHAAQSLNLTRTLAAAAPHVTFSFFNTAKSNRSLFGSTSPLTSSDTSIRVYNVDDGVPENHVFSPNPIEEIDLFIRATPGNFNKGIETAVAETNKKITCVANDAFLWMAGDIAQELGATWVPIWAPGASSLCAHLYTDVIRENFGVGTNAEYDKPLSFIPGMSSVYAGDIPDEILSGNLESLFARMLHKTAQTLPRAPAVAINSFEELEKTIVDNLKVKLQNCLTVGPFTIISPQTCSFDDPSDCLPWLDGQKPATVAYISFGTMATPPPHELAALAEGLEASGVPFLWSLKDGVKVHLPNGFLERTSDRGKVVPWAPQKKLLEHPAVGVIVIHCGWNSVLEAVMGGVPIIYRPFFGDHKLIGRFVSDIWRIGLPAGDGVFTKDGIQSALNMILCEEEGKKIRDNVGAWQREGRQAVGSSGSTTKNLKSLLEIVTTRQQ